MERGSLRSVLLALVLLATSRAEPLEIEILTEWNGGPLDHVPVSLTLDSSSEDVLQLMVQAPFFDDPAPPVPPNSSYIGLWDHEVVELFLLNDADQYVQVELSPHGQYFVILFDGERNNKRFSLPLTVSSVITGGADPSWTATAQIPTDYLPFKVTRVNAYATHGAAGDRHYEAYSPAPSTASGPDYHNLEYFAPIDLDVVIQDLSSRPISELWRNAVLGIVRYSIDTVWNGTPIDHAPVVVMLGGNENEVIFSVEAPFFDDPAPDALPGEPFNTLWNYEVVEVFFLNDENQYLEVEVGPHGQHLDLLLWTKNDTYNQMRHSLPMTFSSMIDRDTATWTGTAHIPVDYLPPKVTRFNAYCKHIPGAGRHEESLYPQDPSDEVADFHALKYFRPIDMNSIVPSQSERPMSQLWRDTIQGIFRYEVTKEWNSVPVAHPPTVLTLEGFEAGVELNVTAPFYNDPAPGGTPGEPFYGLWDYEVVEMFFLNDNEEYLEVELGPWGEHLLLMLKGQRNAIKHSLPLDYVVTTRENGTAPLPGIWQASALIPPGYFPPNVSRVNAYAIHGTGDDKHYEALYPAPLDDPRYPQPDFHRLELFQKMDFEFLVVDNSQYSDLWLEAIANATTPAPADDGILTGVTEGASVVDELTRSSVPKVGVETNELFSIETTTIASGDAIASTSATTHIEVTVTEAVPEEQDSRFVTEPVPVDDVSVGVPADDGPANDIPVYDETVNDFPVYDISVVDGPIEEVLVGDASSEATAKEFDQTVAEVVYESTTIQATLTTDLDLEVTTILPQSDEDVVFTTVVPEVTTTEGARDVGVPQPELVKEARRQDLDKPTGNLFRPIPARAPPRTPHPTKLEEKPDMMTSFMPPNVPFSNPSFGVVQQPHFSHQPLFPPSSFFNPHSPFTRQPFPNPSQASYINGQPIAIQGQAQFPLPPQIQLRDQTSSTPTLFLPQQPHLDHLLHHHHQQEQVFLQEQSQNISTTPLQQIDLLQETNEILPDRIQDSDIPSSATGTEMGHPVLISQDTALPASVIQHSVPQVQQVQLHEIEDEQPQVHSHVIEDQEDSLPMVQEGPIENPVQPIIGSQTPFIQPQESIHPIISPYTPAIELQQPVQPIIEPQQPLQHIQPETSPVPIVEPQQSIIEQPEQPIAPVTPERRPAPLLPSVAPATSLRRPAPLLPSVSPQRPLAPAPPVSAPPSMGWSGVVPPTATPHKQSSQYNCVTLGLHSDPILCPIFHECVKENGLWQVYTWRCPRGKYFDEVSRTCVTGFCRLLSRKP